MRIPIANDRKFTLDFPSRFSSINPLYTRKIPLSNIRNGIPKTPASIVNE